MLHAPLVSASDCICLASQETNEELYQHHARRSFIKDSSVAIDEWADGAAHSIV
jgi:hypothetical protein